MTTIPWYKSAILRQQIVQIITSALLLFGVASENIDVDQTIGLVLGGIAGLTALWTFVTRLVKPTPPITAVAVVASKDREAAIIKKNGGFVRGSFLAAIIYASVLMMVSGTAMLLTPGCASTGTRAAYSEADDPAELAYVLTEHYASLLEQAANLRQKPGMPAAAIEAMQRADRLAQPALRALRPLRDAYLASKSPTDQMHLQVAVDRAVLAIADLVRSIQTAKGAKP